MLQPVQDILFSKSILLGSSSPRRKEIFKNVMNLNFTVKKSDFEDNLDKSKFSSPNEYAKCTALHKTQDVVVNIFKNKEQLPDVIIGGDTVVYMGKQIIEKPASVEDAVCILSMLSGRTHSVCTGMVLMIAKNTALQIDDQSQLFSAYYDVTTFDDVTQVEFDLLTDEVIQLYVKTGEPIDKAGGYGIQGLGGSLIKGIHGDFFNVMGLPCNKLCKDLLRTLTTN